MTQQNVMDWSAQTGSGPELYQSFLVPGMFTPFAERLLDVVGVDAGARVLDIACGTGVVARAAARRAGGSGAVTGVDMGPPMLAVARAQPVDDGAAPITYLEGDALALPVDADAFDVVTCHHGLQFFPDRGVAVAQMHRALRDGGRVGIGCWTDLAATPHFAALVGVLERHLGAEPAAMMTSPFAVGKAELAGLLRDAGFADVRVDAVRLPVTFPSHSQFARNALGAGPLAPIFAAASPEVQEAIIADTTVALAPVATPQDTITSEMTSLVAIATA